MPSRNGSVDGEGRREKSSAEPPVNVKEAEEKSRSRSREGSKKRRSRSDNKASASRSRFVLSSYLTPDHECGSWSASRGF